jgi:hypothetical protein
MGTHIWKIMLPYRQKIQCRALKAGSQGNIRGHCIWSLVSEGNKRRKKPEKCLWAD